MHNYYHQSNEVFKEILFFLFELCYILICIYICLSLEKEALIFNFQILFCLFIHFKYKMSSILQLKNLKSGYSCVSQWKLSSFDCAKQKH